MEFEDSYKPSIIVRIMKSPLKVIPKICWFELIIFLSVKPGFHMIVGPGFHMVVTVGNASPRHARAHIGDSCDKWKRFLNDVSDVTDQTD